MPLLLRRALPALLALAVLCGAARGGDKTHPTDLQGPNKATQSGSDPALDHSGISGAAARILPGNLEVLCGGIIMMGEAAKIGCRGTVAAIKQKAEEIVKEAVNKPGSQVDPGATDRAMVQAVEESVKADPNDPNMRSLLSAVRVSQGRYDEALQDSQAALKLDPQNKFAAQMLAYVKSTQRQVRMDQPLVKPDFGAQLSPQALDSVAAAGAVGPAPAGGKEIRPAGASGTTAAAGAGLPMPQAQAPGADSRIPAAITAPAPTPARVLMRAAYQKWRVGDLSGALLDFSRAVDQDRRDSYAWSGRAFMLNQVKEHPAAKSDAEESLRLDSRNGQGLREKAYAEFQLGDLASALSDIDAAIALEPGNGLGYLYRAMVYEKLGRPQEAARDYAQAARLDPGLRLLCEQGLARLSGGAAAPGPAVGPGRRLVMPGLIMLAVLLLVAGTVRMTKKGWRTALSGQAQTPPPLNSALSPVPGSVLAGNFRVEGELGRGGMGVVYLAEDLTLKRKVAVKLLGQAALEEPELRARFIQEAQTAAKLRHPNLAQIFSVAEDGGQIYLVFEFVEGTPLDKLLGLEGRLPLDQVRRILRELCGALEHAHGQKIIHRDLKPANVMLAKDGACRIMDFGIAHEAHTMSGSTRTAAWGTPPYMAPEQELGQVSRESDLYALGVMAYELLTGSRPYDGCYMLDRKLRKDFPPATQAQPGLPPDIDGFFARALEPDAGQRFHSAAEFLAAFEAAGRAS